VSRVANWLWLLILARVRRPPDVVIGGSERPYMLRWHLIPRNRLFNVYLHHFLRSDDDRALHDHPWWNASFLLQGSYTEHTIAAGGVHCRKLYNAGDIKLRGAKSAHRVELTHGSCWSLFLTGPWLRSWGFHCPNGWKHWKAFTKPGRPGEVGEGCGE